MKITSTFIIVLLCAALIGAVLWACYERQTKLNSNEQIKKEVAALTNPTAPLVDQFKNPAGQTVSRFNTTGNEVSPGFVAVSPSVLDTVSKLSGIDKKDVVDYKEIAITLQAQNLKANQVIDSLRGRVFYYRDKFLELSYTPSRNPEDVNDNGLFSYKYNAKFVTLDHTKGKRFLGLPIGTQETFTDVFSQDTSATIDGLRTLKIKPNQNYFSVNPYAFANYLFDEANVQTGAGLKIQLNKRLSVKGGYYYNTNDFRISKPKPFAGAEYNFFK